MTVKHLGQLYYYYIVYLKVSKRGDLESPHHKKK